MERNERRRTHYQMLRACGFKPKNATILKDYDRETIEQLCAIKRDAQKSIDPVDKVVADRIEDVLTRKRKGVKTS